MTEHEVVCCPCCCLLILIGTGVLIGKWIYSVDCDKTCPINFEPKMDNHDMSCWCVCDITKSGCKEFMTGKQGLSEHLTQVKLKLIYEPLCLKGRLNLTTGYCQGA